MKDDREGFSLYVWNTVKLVEDSYYVTFQTDLFSDKCSNSSWRCFLVRGRRHLEESSSRIREQLKWPHEKVITDKTGPRGEGEGGREAKA